MSKKHKMSEDLDPGSSNSETTSSYISLTSVLNSTDDDIPWITYKKNLDNLQEELEHLFNDLNHQHNVLSSVDTSNSDSLPITSEENRKHLNNEEASMPASEIKAEKNNFDSDRKQYPGRARSKPIKSQDLEFSLKSDIPKQQKNDAPNRFWSFVEAYCSDITKDDIKMLENWIEVHNKDIEYQDAPPLGTHYSSTWTESDILEEMKEGSKSVENPRGTEFSLFENTCGSELLDKVKNENLSQHHESPSLIQNLISSLVHENIIASSDVMAESIPDNEVSEVIESEPKSHHPVIAVMEDTLEHRLLRDLKESGLVENFPRQDDDELYLELKQMQALLIPVSKYNLQMKKELLARAKAEMTKQESLKRIQEADAKVMESYRAMSAARSKGKKLSKNELYIIRTMLEERDVLIKTCKVNS